MAIRCCVGDTSARTWRFTADVVFVPGPVTIAVAFVAGEKSPEKRDAGWAIKSTPIRDITAASCSKRVNGSWIKSEQAQQLTIGARKVITVASAIGRYSRESKTGISLAHWRFL